MGKLVAVLTVFCFGSLLPVAAQQRLQASTMVFAQEAWDFGSIREADGRVSHTFEFTNTGDLPFVIENVVVTCGCTTPEYTRQPVLPGRKGFVRVIYDPRGRPGAFRKTVTVWSNNRANKNELVIEGDVLPRPESVNDEFPVLVGDGLQVTRTSAGVGYVARGTTKSVTVEYYNNSPRPLSLEVVYEDPRPWFSVVLSAPSVASKQKGVMTITYDLRDADLWGRLTDRFGLRIDGIDAARSFSATGIVTEDFSGMSSEERDKAPRPAFDAQYYDFGSVKAGETRSREFTLTNGGEQPLVVRSVKPAAGTSSSLKAGTRVAPGESVVFTLTLDTSGAGPGKLSRLCEIIMNDPLRPMREIRLVANVI